MKKHLTKNNLIIGLLIILIICLIIIILLINHQNAEKENHFEVKNYLVVSVNPKVLLNINDENIITGVFQLNDDAYIFQNADLKNLEIEEGIIKILEILKNNNYLTEDANLELSYFENSKVAQNISKIENVLTNNNVNYTINYITKKEEKDITQKLENYEEKDNNSLENVEDNIDSQNNSSTPSSDNNKTDNNNNSNTNNNSNSSNNNSNNSSTNGWNCENGFCATESVGEGCLFSLSAANSDVKVKNPSWFSFYPGDRWATSKEVRRNNIASNALLIVRDSYNDQIVESSDADGFRYTKLFYQFLPDNIDCLSNLCAKGDLDCYDDIHYEYRGKIYAINKNIENFKGQITSSKYGITQEQERIKEQERYIEEYCSEMTNENDLCVYHTTPYNYEMTWGYSIKDHKNTIKESEKTIKELEQGIKIDERELHYEELNLYQYEKIYDYIKEHFPLS